MNRNLEIKPPLKLVRLISGLAFIFVGIFLTTTIMEPLSDFSLLHIFAGILIITGICIAFLQRVVLLDTANREMRIEWRIAGYVISSTVYTISAADRVVVSIRQEAFVPDAETVFVADRSYPVLLCAGNETIVRVIGWKTDKTKSGFTFDISLPSSAFFISFSRHVAARLAKALNLPLEYQPDKKNYSVSEIPPEWLDPKSVRIILTWRRYN
jgi:hypothetical protein